MRKDAFVLTAAVLLGLLATAGIASARCSSVAVAGRVVAADGAPAQRGTLVLEEIGTKARRSLPLECRDECTFAAVVPAGLYRATVMGVSAVEGHRALLAERLDLRAQATDLRLQLASPIAVSGPLGEGADTCPSELPSITFRRSADGEEFGAAVSCARGEGPGFAARLEPGVYDVKVELPGGRTAVAHALALRTDVADLPLGVLLPHARQALLRF